MFPSDLSATIVKEDWWAPRDSIFISNEGPPTIILHPARLMEILNNGRVPFWSEYTLGGKEAERDRRRKRR